MTQAHLLIVDDDAAVLNSLAANLELEGYQVTTAESAEIALDLVAQHTFDVILSDMRMPGLSGLEFYRRVKVVRPGVPVVLMTAFVQEGLVLDAVKEGIYTVLPKPVEIERISRLVSRAHKRTYVVVVDDSVPHAQSLAAALEAAGVRAKAVFDGPSAINAIRAGEADVCVVDLHMPGMDGTRVLEEVKANFPEVPVIAFSGQALAEVMAPVARRGAAACFQTPIAIDDLLQAISRARRRATLPPQRG